MGPRRPTFFFTNRSAYKLTGQNLLVPRAYFLRAHVALLKISVSLSSVNPSNDGVMNSVLIQVKVLTTFNYL